MASEGDAAAPPPSRREQERAATRQLLAQAESLLASVDASEFMKARRPRQYPRFARTEVRLGPLLGVGGFGIVFEIEGLSLTLPTEAEFSKEGDEETPPTGVKADGTKPSTDDSTSARMRTPETEHIDPEIATVSPLDEAHYEVTTARQYMRENVRRNGDARYAIKRLHRDLRDLDRVRGMIDLAIEAKFLSAVWHPNVGTCVGGGEFLVRCPTPCTVSFTHSSLH
jgi:hypothetical protein